MRWIIGLFLILAMAVLPGCSRSQVIELNESDSGRQLTVSSGDQVRITLEGNPTTGYQWALAPLSGSTLKLAREPEYVGPSNSGLVGAGGTYHFQLLALAPGSEQVFLKYYRSFEPDVAPIRTFELSVTVTK